jgi:hypothetical protein
MSWYKITFKLRDFEEEFSYVDYYKVGHYSDIKDLFDARDNAEKKIKQNCSQTGRNFDKIVRIEEIQQIKE